MALTKAQTPNFARNAGKTPVNKLFHLTVKKTGNAKNAILVILTANRIKNPVFCIVRLNAPHIV